MVKVKLSDGKFVQSKGKTGNDLVVEHQLQGALALEMQGKICDLTTTVSSDATILTFADKGGKEAFWHSSAHILAYAVSRLYPDAKPTIGPAIDEGFYYDFDDLEITKDDFKKIQQECRKIIKEKLDINRNEISLAEAKKFFKKNKYKVELAEQAAEGGATLSTYSMGAFVDLCEGPHIPNTKMVGAIKILRASGAYWKGDQKNKQLTRIYAISFPTKDEVKQWVKNREEALKRDHVILGKKLDLFCTSEVVGKGLPLLTPKGASIFRTIFRWVQDEELRRGYRHTKTPCLTKSELYKISGHWDHYKDDLFSFKAGDDVYALRPMTCPHQFMVYKRKKYSYRELPIRLAEISELFRHEQSGELHGLIRLQQFTLADAHIICRPDQLEQEFTEVLDLIQHMMKTLNITDYWYRFSKRDDEGTKEKYVDNPKMWKKTQDDMRNILDKLKVDYVEVSDEAAFYGPKLDVQMRNVFGKEDTAMTIQIDFHMPDRFELEYTDEESKPQRPLVIHRSSVGCIERTMAFLIEHYAGKFPLWVSPEQVRVLTIADRFNDYAQKYVQSLMDLGIRATLDVRNESISKKVREAQLQYVNYILVVGEKELEAGTVAIRHRSGKQLEPMKKAEFTKKLVKEIEDKVLDV
jgi:threonyl-tRNA synthetase